MIFKFVMPALLAVLVSGCGDAEYVYCKHKGGNIYFKYSAYDFIPQTVLVPVFKGVIPMNKPAKYKESDFEECLEPSMYFHKLEKETA